MKEEIDENYYYNVGRLNRYSYSDYLEFGKYKEKKIFEVMEIAPDYLEWCILEIDEFVLDEIAEKELKITHKYCLSKKATEILKLKQYTYKDIERMESKCEYEEQQRKKWFR
jgi:hypothetical protein